MTDSTTTTTLLQTSSQSCNFQYRRMKRCIAYEACGSGCFADDEALVEELYQAFASNIPETPSPTAAPVEPEPTLSPTRSASPTVSEPPTNTDIGDFDFRRRAVSLTTASSTARSNGRNTPKQQQQQQRHRQRNLQDGILMAEEDEEDMFDTSTASPTISSKPTAMPVPTTPIPTPPPQTLPPTVSPTPDSRGPEFCPDPSDAVCGLVLQKDCCCQVEIDRFAECAVGRVFPKVAGLGGLSCGRFYDGCGGGLIGKVDVGGTEEEGVEIGLILAILVPVLVLLGCALGYVYQRRKRNTKLSEILSEPITTKETESGTASFSSSEQMSYAISSMQGWRRHMEDRHLIHTPTQTQNSDDDDDLAIFAVFDGHGGESSSDFLSRSLVDTLSQQDSFQEYKRLKATMALSPLQQRGLLELALERTCVDLEYGLMQFLKERNRRRSERPTSTESDFSDNVDEEQPPLKKEKKEKKNAKKTKNTKKNTKNTKKKKKPPPTEISPSYDNCPANFDYWDDSGSTAVIVLVTPQWTICANVGDSRSILATSPSSSSSSPHLNSTNTTLRTLPLSTDHKPLHPPEYRRVVNHGGTIRREGRKGEVGKVFGILAVSRAFGDFKLKDYSPIAVQETGEEIVRRQVISAVPEVVALSSREEEGAGKRMFLVLACDGIWDVMESEECVAFIQDLWAGDLSLSVGDVCERVLDECLKRGSKDNMSLMIVRFSAYFG